MTLKLVEDFAVTQLRKDVRDSLQMGGEQCIVLQLRHEQTDGDAERCPSCDDDIYKEAEGDCLVCYGTRFAQPIKQALKVWAMFADQVDADEQLTKRGQYQTDNREMQIEAFPELTQHDIVVRVRRWTPEGRVAEIEGYYIVDKVTANSVRTGNRFGQHQWDIVGQKANVTELPSSVAIAKFPVVGKTFDAPIVDPVGTMAVPPPVSPDTKVVYVPVTSEPSIAGAQWRQMYIHNQTNPATTWTVRHPFDHTPAVILLIDGEQADTDVDYPEAHVVVLTFATPQVGTAQLF